MQVVAIGLTELCGRCCIKDFCGFHMARIRSGSDYGPKPCIKCGHGMKNKFNICIKCGYENIQMKKRQKDKCRIVLMLSLNDYQELMFQIRY